MAEEKKSNRNKNVGKLAGTVKEDFKEVEQRVKIELLKIALNANRNANKDCKTIMKDAQSLYEWVNEK